MIKVNDIYRTIQGEGRWTGTPMVLLRLHGCSVGCSWCDTKQTWKSDYPPEKSLIQALGSNRAYAVADESDIARHCREVAGKNIDWVMLTGGEPCEQNLEELILSLHGEGFRICLETSGTPQVPSWLHKFDWVCLSPKYGFKSPSDSAYALADEIKLVVTSKDDVDFALSTLKQAKSRSKVVSLQPVHGSKSALDICVFACMAHGFNLSIQVHKEIDIQ